LYDCTLEHSEEAFRCALDRHRPRLVALCEDNFNFVTKMCLTRNRELAFFMCRAANARGVPVVVNSSDSTDHASEYLRNGADFVILGEVEATLVEMAGHAAPPGGRIFPQREPIKDLDSLPLPAWDLIDAEAYRRAWITAHGYFSLNMVSSRGCPYRCNWCSKPIHGSSYNTRSA